AILARQPDALPVRNNLAWLLAEQGAAAEALQLLETDAGAERWREELAHTRSFARCRQHGHAVTECERRAAARQAFRARFTASRRGIALFYRDERHVTER